MKGFVNINKSIDMTSSDAVVMVRGILRRATGEKQKTGHLGTLDPLATGVLPIAIGNATRLFDYMQSKQKEYIATFKFGIETDTLDRGGKITASDNKSISKSDIEKVLEHLIGDIAQIPPQYSAKSIGGRRAYDIARSGGVAELQPKQVIIHDLKIIGDCENTVNLPSGEYNTTQNEFAFKITCGSGTYIRAIARDMARLLGTVGYMSSLCRVKSGDFEINNAVSLTEFESNPLKFVMPIESALPGFDRIDLNQSDAFKVLNGISIPCEKRLKAPISVYVCGNTVGLGEVSNGKLRLVTRF